MPPGYSAEEVSKLSVEFGICSHWLAPVIEIGGPSGVQPVQILNRRVSRDRAIIRVDTLEAADAVFIAHRPDYLSKPSDLQGCIFTAPFQITWQNQQPCYAIAVGTPPGNVVISTIDQTASAMAAQAEEMVQMGDGRYG